MNPQTKKNLTIALILFLVLAIPLTLFVIGRSTDRQSQAAALSQETESGVISSPATIQNDTSASGGQFVQFGQ